MVIHSMTNIYTTDFDTYRQLGDTLADDAFLYLKEHSSLQQKLYQLNTNAEIADLLSEYHPLSQLVSEMVSVRQPDLTSGARFFQQHTPELLAMLGLYSLPYCYAGAKGVRVLYHSKKIRENPKQRLLETAGFVFDVAKPHAFLPEGRGLLSALKVRLMHAAVRYYSKRLIEDEVPINQEDLAGTLLSFSLLPIRGMKKTGLQVSESEAISYLTLWSYIGQLMGVDRSLIPCNLAEVSQLEIHIRKRQFYLSMEGSVLCRSLLDYLKTEKLPLPVVDIEDVVVELLGEEVAACLGLKNEGIKSKAALSAFTVSNFLKSFSESQFTNIVNQFEQRLIQEKVKPDFKITF